MMKKEQLFKYNLEIQRFWQLLVELELDVFSFSDILAIDEFREYDIQPILENLVKSKFLKRIEKGKYCVFNFNNHLVIGNFLVPDGAVAYWSALHLHNLTEQIPNTVFVQTTKLKRNKTIFGVAYKFVKVKPQKITGITTQGHGNHQYRITDREKTIVDCFDLPQYAGGWPELMRAVAEGGFSQDKLIDSCKAVNNIAATKRLAFLVELLELPNMNEFLDFAQSMVRKKYNVFDPFGKNEGAFVAKWKLRLNIPKKIFWR